MVELLLSRHQRQASRYETQGGVDVIQDHYRVIYHKIFSLATFLLLDDL